MPKIVAFPWYGGKTVEEILLMRCHTRSRWYKTISPEEKAEAMKIVEIARRTKMSIFLTGKKRPEHSKLMMGENNFMYGKHHSDKSKAKARASMMDKHNGENNPSFNNWASREPYCYIWNDVIRERIRNRYGRTCRVCGKSALQDKRRLCVDHIDENKMQGCDDWEWRLAPLCSPCHSKMNNKTNHLLFQLLTLKNQKQESNIMIFDLFMSKFKQKILGCKTKT